MTINAKGREGGGGGSADLLQAGGLSCLACEWRGREGSPAERRSGEGTGEKKEGSIGKHEMGGKT